MNAERLLAHYHEIADAPDAIARLRRFVLDLAVRGKLVPQDAKDEPASELLKRIATEKARLVKAGEARKSEVDPVIEGDVPFPTPAKWVWTRLGSIADWGSGSTPSRGNLDFYGGGITWLKSGELNDNRRLAGSEETVTQLAIEKSSFRINRPGDVLIAMYGATIGKAAILADNAVTNQAVCGCTPFAGVFNEFLFLFLLSQREQFHSASEGGAQPNISKVKIVWTPFPLPPLAEQHRIVAKVDELMGLCDRLEAARGKREAVRDRLAAASLARLNAPDPDTFRDDVLFTLEALPALTARADQITQLRRAILNLAVCGKLVPQNAGDKPASGLLKLIVKEKSRLLEQRGIKGDRPLPAVDEAERSFSTPVGWCWARAQDLSLKISDGVHNKPNYVASGIPFVTVKNLTEGPGISFRETKFITERDHAEFIKRTHPEKGDVLITKDGTIGVARVIDTDRIFSIFVSVALVKMVLPSIAPFLTLCINADVVRDTIVPKGAALKHLHLVDLRKLPLPLPPLAEQHRIVAKVDKLMALCDRLEASLTATATIRRRLLDALLAEALAPAEDRELEAAE